MPCQHPGWSCAGEAAINCVPHALAPLREGVGDGRGLEIQIPHLALGMSLNTISLSEMMELQFTSHKEEFKVPYSRAQTSSKRVTFPHQFPHPSPSWG